MNQADDELRHTIKHMWPLQGPKLIDLLVPPREMLNGNHLTVGKIYGGLLILESWRSSRFGQTNSGLPVSLVFERCMKEGAVVSLEMNEKCITRRDVTKQKFVFYKNFHFSLG